MKNQEPTTFAFGEVQLSYKKKRKSKFDSIRSSKDVEWILRKIFPKSQINFREHFYALYLNNQNKVVGYQLISLGGITQTVIDIRILFSGAILCNSVGLIICHNHPSGKLKPSEQDLKITKKIAKACEILDIKLLDHIIITDKTYLSFSDDCLL